MYTWCTGYLGRRLHIFIDTFIVELKYDILNFFLISNKQILDSINKNIGEVNCRDCIL